MKRAPQSVKNLSALFMSFVLTGTLLGYAVSVDSASPDSQNVVWVNGGYNTNRDAGESPEYYYMDPTPYIDPPPFFTIKIVDITDENNQYFSKNKDAYWAGNGNYFAWSQPVTIKGTYDVTTTMNLAQFKYSGMVGVFQKYVARNCPTPLKQVTIK